jgi:hypothetical protein
MENSSRKFAMFLEMKLPLYSLTTRGYNNRTKYSDSRPFDKTFQILRIPTV